MTTQLDGVATPVDTSDRAGIQAVISDILTRHRDGALTDPRGRSAVAAFVTSYAPDGFLSESDEGALDVFLDITLQMSKLARQAADPEVQARVATIIQVALGDEAALPVIRSTY